ncbi:hypothetical protein [Legionella steigerwaltii]|uniref:hypothetical protein n=1 Tax=Legionella steigerwaltii TaxID=460 RepID=UPI001054A611|nr:hypothetical protein [Legionella steigerwaltii]
MTKEDIVTETIRWKYADLKHINRYDKTKNQLTQTIEDSDLATNVIIRLEAFRKKLDPIKNQQQVFQQQIFQAKTLVNLTNDDVVANRSNLTRMQGDYLNLLSSSETSLESLAEFDRNFDLLFGQKTSSALQQELAERKRIMGRIIEECVATSVEEGIKKEQSKLNELIKNTESILEQATDLKKLSELFQQVKTIERVVTQKAAELLSPSDVQKLKQLIQFIEEKEKEILRIKEGITGAEKVHQQTIQAIEKIEKSIQQKKEQAASFLEEMRNSSSKDQQKAVEEDHVPVEVDQRTDQTVGVIEQPIQQKNEQAESFKEQPPTREDHQDNGEPPPESDRILKVKKARLQEAISLINAYKETLEYEKKHSIKFFHRSRNQAKIDYCNLLKNELSTKVDGLKSDSKLLSIIKEAHEKAIKSCDAQEVTKGGSYFGTSRMLSVQRLLGIAEAWETKGRSKFLGFSRKSDFHGLKTSGIVTEHEKKTVENFYNEEAESNDAYQKLKEQVFPKATGNSKTLN